MMMLVATLLPANKDTFNPLAYFTFENMTLLAELGGIVIMLRDGMAYAMAPTMVQDWVRYSTSVIKMKEQNPGYMTGRCPLDVKLSTLSVGQGSMIAMLHNTLITAKEPLLNSPPPPVKPCKR